MDEGLVGEVFDVLDPAIHEDFQKILCVHPPASGLAEEEAKLFGEVATGADNDGYEVDSAHQGEEGLGLAVTALEQDRPYALAFVDVRMPPGWDGIETVDQLWKRQPDLQVVLCTAYSDYSWDALVRGSGDRIAC